MLSERDSDQYVAHLNKRFDHTIPTSIDAWIYAEEIARLYRIVTKPDVSKRYFRMAARGKEQRLMAFRMRGGKVTHATDCAHTALLYHYAGDVDRAQNLFKQAVVEANLLLCSPLLNVDRRTLLQMLLYIGLINGEYSKLDQYLDALKEVCSKEPGLFLTAYKTLDMALRARATADKKLAKQAIELLHEYVVQEGIAPYATGYISEWDILELLTAIEEQIS